MQSQKKSSFHHGEAKKREHENNSSLPKFQTCYHTDGRTLSILLENLQYHFVSPPGNNSLELYNLYFSISFINVDMMTGVLHLV